MKTKISVMNIVIIVLTVIVISAMAVYAVFLSGNGFGAKREHEKSASSETGKTLMGITCGTTVKIDGTDAVSYDVTDAEGETENFAETSEMKPYIVKLASFDDTLSFVTRPTESLVVVTDEKDSELFRGTAEQFNDSFSAPSKGTVFVEITAVYRDVEAEWRNEKKDKESEKYTMTATQKYALRLEYDVVIDFHLSSENLSQGDVLIFCADGLSDKGDLSIEVPFPFTPTLQKTEKGYYAYIPLNYMRTEGEYTITATYNGEKKALSFNITEPEYEVQHLTVSGSTTSSTIGNNNAMETYNSTMDRLGSMYDETVYWTENFIQPVDGSITTEFGMKRYTNNSTTPSRHAGIDIATAEGTPVKASNAGKIIFADFLAVSGNTVVIEHGMGLHTIYMHMSELDCSQGDTVAQGDIIGKVGTTGFSTGPHLHFQAQVNTACINPWYLFDGTSGVYGIKEYIS
ncbi:MAG: M23 family metallopeptidase [Oscillospiraceae bacterium]